MPKKEAIVNAKVGSLLVGAGFLLGTVGVKALTSQQAKKCYVHGVAGALRVKQGYEEIVEQAKAEVDDIVAEATYLNANAAKPAVGDERPVDVSGAGAPASEPETSRRPANA